MMTGYDLERFSTAQAGVFDTALAEIRAGAKRSHWMWFIFPQIAGLGNSPTARHFAIASLDEARAYLADGVLGPRYLSAVEVLQALSGGTAHGVFGGIDAIKLRSSLTLFEAAGAPAVVGEALDRWFGGERDARTLEIVGRR
jgi:uncharacterized protein (DUF1810 family)